MSCQIGHECTTRPLPQHRGQDVSAQLTMQNSAHGDQVNQKSVRGLERTISSLSLDDVGQPNVSFLGSCSHVD